MGINFEQIWGRKWAFLLTFFLVFTVSYIVLVALDWLPEAPTSDSEQPEEVESVPVVDVSNEENQSTSIQIDGTGDDQVVDDEKASSTNEVILPTSIAIKKLDKVVSVSNPTSRSIADLDAALLNGAVRHPDSATMSQEGTVFMLGHSSYLPTVFNKNFQAFNGIQNLEWGDTIEVFSDNQVFEYRVEKVYRAQAKDVTVPIAGTGKTLVLATCNSFGSVDDRYIVEAKQINVKSL